MNLKPTDQTNSVASNIQPTAATSARIRRLRTTRETSNFLRYSFALGILVCLAAWFVVDVDWTTAFSGRRVRNFERFLGEINPLRNQDFSWSAYLSWFFDLWRAKGAVASLKTFCISFAAITLAGTLAVACLFLASRNVAHPTNETFRRLMPWRIISSLMRGLFIVTRAIPEYIWAFLFIAMFGPSAWPAILAIGLHNFGILGKLGAEVVENANPAIPNALRSIGLSRAQIAVTAIAPMSLGKWLLLFFYRWETCIREATVLGMLGIVSLGFLIRDSRARDHYDEMLALVLMGSLLVLIADIASAIVRRYVRAN
jgi:phosphonate transport system permease protein